MTPSSIPGRLVGALGGLPGAVGIVVDIHLDGDPGRATFDHFLGLSTGRLHRQVHRRASSTPIVTFDADSAGETRTVNVYGPEISHAIAYPNEPHPDPWARDLLAKIIAAERREGSTA